MTKMMKQQQQKSVVLEEEMEDWLFTRFNCLSTAGQNSRGFSVRRRNSRTGTTLLVESAVTV
ncbi:BPK_collapsed_G0003790.mRNA.1.CDS.1 [Saccharomyces cerevisiae]|nr:BPK_collapsed_G0003790.mRNA.1.CDS.1 [Saccharomyces cerevisiae]